MNLLLEITKSLKDKRDKKFLLAMSAGLDSMALFHIFLHFRQNFQVQFSVCNFHHGPSDDSLTLDYRFNAYEKLKDLCVQKGVGFLSNCQGDRDNFLKNFGEPLQGENDFRQARYQYFETLKNEMGFDELVLAHHQDDLMETRLLRLIRGVGPQGLGAMNEQSGWIYRPLLGFSRAQLKAFLLEQNGSWLEDPSNDDLHYLRNWLRKKWLRELEEKVPGGVQALGRSLEQLTQQMAESPTYDQCFENGAILVSELLALQPSNQRQVLASYMKSQGLRNYGVSHINEVLKRLDTEKKSHTFRLLAHSWIVDAGRMSVEKPS